jgi:hypothetical protein
MGEQWRAAKRVLPATCGELPQLCFSANAAEKSAAFKARCHTPFIAGYEGSRICESAFCFSRVCCAVAKWYASVCAATSRCEHVGFIAFTPGRSIMLNLSPDVKVYVYNACVDMRKSIDGLVALLVNVFEQNPQQGDLFVFSNRHHNKIKVLFWDKNGFVIYYKRLEKGRFQYSRHIQDDKIVVTTTQFKALLMGLDFYLLGHYPAEYYQDFF